MALLKKKENGRKTIVALNNALDIAAKINGATLGDVDSKDLLGKLVDIRPAISNVVVNGKDTTIHAIALETEDAVYIANLSRGLDFAKLQDPELLPECKFRMNRKYKDLEEAEAGLEPTGALQITFGKPEGLTYELGQSLVEPVAATA